MQLYIWHVAQRLILVYTGDKFDKNPSIDTEDMERTQHWDGRSCRHDYSYQPNDTPLHR